MKNNAAPIINTNMNSLSISFDDLNNNSTQATPAAPHITTPTEQSSNSDITYDQNQYAPAPSVNSQPVIVAPAQTKPTVNAPQQTTATKVDELLQDLNTAHQPLEVDENVGQLAVEFMLDNNLLVLPDHITELNPSNFSEVIEYTRQFNIAQAVEYVVSNIEDESYKEAIRATINGGTIDDAKVVQSLLEWEQELTSIDLTKERGQRSMLQQYFYQELREDSPMLDLLKGAIDNNINNIIVSGNGEKEATKALNALKAQIQTEKSSIAAKIEKAKRDKEIARTESAKKVREWQYSMLRDLRNSGWDPRVQDTIIKHTDRVEFADGTSMYLWEYKLKQILKSPTDVKYLFKFLSSYDHETLKFHAATKSPSLTATDKILGSINVNSQKPVTSRTVNKEGSTLGNKPYVSLML